MVPPEAYALAGAIALAAIVPILVDRSSDEFVRPRFWIAVVYVVCFVVRPLYILLLEDQGHPYIRLQPDMPARVVDGLCLAAFGILLFWVGHSLRLGAHLGSALPVLPNAISPRRWRQAVAACLLVGLIGYVLLLRRIGGVGNLLGFLYLRGVVYASDDATGPLKEVAKLVGTAAVLGMHQHIWVQRTRWAWPLLILCSAIMATMGSRGAVAQIWVAVYVLYALRKAEYRTWRTVLTIGLVVGVFASAFLSFRRATKLGVTEALYTLYELPSEFLENLMDSAPMFDHMVAAMEVSGRDFPRREGTTYLEVAPLMVPRAVWAIEVEGAGPSLRKAIEPMGLGGRPSSAMGEGYMNFGIVGALLPMLALGIWTRLIWTYAVRTRDRSQIGSLLYTFLLIGTPRLLAGVAALAIRGILVDVVAVLLAFIWSARASGLGTPDEAAPGQGLQQP